MAVSEEDARKEALKRLHNLFNQIIPFCRAGSNPQVIPKIERAERLFIFLEEFDKRKVVKK